jgi:hypothetical protein
MTGPGSFWGNDWSSRLTAYPTHDASTGTAAQDRDPANYAAARVKYAAPSEVTSTKGASWQG